MALTQAVNGNYASVADVNEFFDLLNGVSSTITTTTQGTTSQPPFQALTPSGTGVQDFIEGAISGDTGPRIALGVDFTHSGYGTFATGVGGSVTGRFYATSNGWRCDQTLSLSGTFTASSDLQATTVTASSSVTNSGTISAGSGSNSCNQIANGGTWATSTAGAVLGFGDDVGNSAVAIAPSGPSGAGRNFALGVTNGSGVELTVATFNSDGTTTLSGPLTFLNHGSIAEIVMVGGSGNATVSHGMGVSPANVSVCGHNSSAGVYTWWNSGSSTFSVATSGGGSWTAICYKDV